MNDFFERKKNELNIDLNEVQKKAVLQTEGPLLLLACPGFWENDDDDYANWLFD